MRRVKSEELSAILDFLYCGETSIYQENLDSFLTIAEELKLEGLKKQEEFGCPPEKISNEYLSQVTDKSKKVNPTFENRTLTQEPKNETMSPRLGTS